MDRGMEEAFEKAKGTEVDLFAQLTQDALRLKELDKLSVKFVLEGNRKELVRTLTEFIELKKKIKKNLIECPIAKIHNKIAQEVLKKISQEEIFQTEKILGSSDELDFDEKDELRDLFYSWFSHFEYLEGLYEIGSLVVGYSVPDFLESYVSGARLCYAFQQYNAVYGLCRTIIEIAIRDKCERMQIIRKDEKIIDFNFHSPRKLINKCTKGSLRDSLHNILDDTNILIHGRKTVEKKGAKQMFKDTLRAVQELYDN